MDHHQLCNQGVCRLGYRQEEALTNTMAFDIVQQKLRARRQGDRKERNRLKRLFEETAKDDREQYFNRIADEAEAGMVQNDLRAAYRVINVFGGNSQAQRNRTPINDASGVPCKSEDDILQRWTEH